MPKINELLNQRENKKFIKRNYRPWNLNGDEDIVPQQQNYSHNNRKPLREHVDNTEPSIREPMDNEKNFIDNNKLLIEKHLDNIKKTVKLKLETNEEQLDNTLGNVIKDNITEEAHIILKNLTGIQEKIFQFILDICCSLNQLETGPLSTYDLAAAANCNYGSAKTSLKRLIDKGILIRKKGRTAKSGYLNLSINQEIKLIALQLNQEKIRTKLITKTLLMNKSNSILDNITDNNLDNIHSNSSSNKNITTTLPEEWKKIDFEDLTFIGFGESHLKQLYEKKCNPEVVQQSIYHFAYGLEHNPSIREKYKDPLNTFMGVLRKGSAWIEAQYESPDTLALKALIESKKQEQTKQQQLLIELAELEFPTWAQNLTEEQKRQYVPNYEEYRLRRSGNTLLEQDLRKHFIEVIFPELFKKRKGV